MRFITFILEDLFLLFEDIYFLLLEFRFLFKYQCIFSFLYK